MQYTKLARSLTVVLALLLALAGFQPALATPPQQEEVTAGIYYSEPYVLANGAEVDLTLILGSDGNAGFITSATDGSGDLTEYGYWENPEPGVVGVFLTGTADEEYANPDVIIFEQDGDTLNALEFNTDFFGEEPFSVMLAVTEEELYSVEADAAAAGVGGVYASDALTAEDGSMGVALLHLAADGTAQGNVNYFDGVTPPDVQLGSWTDNEDGTITLLFDNMLQVTADGAEPVEMDEPIERVYAVGEAGELVGDNLTLYPLTNVDLASEEDTILLFLSDLLPSADTPGRIISVALAEDGGAAMATDYLNDEEPILELGEWEENGDGTLTLTLTGREDMVYDEPVVIVFTYEDDTLTAVEYDQDLFGEEGLTLTLAPEEQAADEADAAADSFSFSSEQLTSADTPGLIITFTFFADGAFEAASDYMNDDPPYMEYGTWEDGANNDGVVTITSSDDGDYDEPIVFTVTAQDDGSILAENEEVFGPDGLLLYPNE